MNIFDNKHILLWGYGREGRSTERFLEAFAKPASVSVFEGTPEELGDEPYDLIIKSPGVPWETQGLPEDYYRGEPGHPASGDGVLPAGESRIRRIAAKLTSQTEIFLSAFRGQTVGVTGTKGKSTTASMLAGVLADCTDRPVLLVGNIGLPCLDYYGEITPETIVVCELSCHQLCHAKAAPHIAVYLNLYEEHLDYYKEMSAYARAKGHIVDRQLPGDFAYLGGNVPPLESASEQIRVLPEEGAFGGEDVHLKLYGAHNRLNAEFVYRIAAERFGCDPEAVRESLARFEPLPHRMKPIGRFAGIDWYDDSISTIPEAAISAAESIPGIQTVLIGGMDRGISYAELEEYLRRRTDLSFILMYATGERIARELTGGDGSTGMDPAGSENGCSLPERNEGGCRDLDTARNQLPAHIVLCADLAEAVEAAREITEEDRGCVLSPAAASYGYFKNFEERGDVFAELVRGQQYQPYELTGREFCRPGGGGYEEKIRGHLRRIKTEEERRART